MAAIIFLMNALTGCALKNENMEAIYKEFLDNGDVGSLQWSWVLEPGQYEDIRFATGTRELLNAIGDSQATKVVGGGDGVSAVKNFKLAEKFTFLSTGGGATLEYIINKGLPAIDNISEK